MAGAVMDERMPQILISEKQYKTPLPLTLVRCFLESVLGILRSKELLRGRRLVTEGFVASDPAQ